MIGDDDSLSFMVGSSKVNDNGFSIRVQKRKSVVLRFSEENMSWGRSPYSLDDDRNMGSRFPSCKSSLHLKGKFPNDKNVSRKRPNDSNAGKNELVPKKRASGLGDEVNSLSGMHSWDALLQKRGTVQEAKHADDGKGMPTQKKGFSPGECLNSHSSWPSWNSCLQMDRSADEATNSASDACQNSRSAVQSWNSWLQNRWGAEHSKDSSQKRVSRSGDRGGSHYNKPPLKSGKEN
ncbi:hypothetical protein DM860_017975 [Cuscuta australis]|uniref:Uncharacterized protein n=2 Tax=Cuscuta sect. Cleistogrammica TaxID=1824901 RepID=A0A328DWG2_9ASTE|nr:hypothetical protein DM860_017975 [Cuscuta australis]